MQIQWRFVKNGIANLGRGSAAAVVALLLPPILVRHMQPPSYVVWVLVLQSAAYVSYLNFGLQTAIGRYVAYAEEKGDRDQRDSIYSTAFVGLCGAAALSFVCLLTATMEVSRIFPSTPHALIPQMQIALLVVGISAALELPASAWSGVFIGLQRYEVPALIVGGSRLLSALGILAAALTGHSIVMMAVAMAAANLLSYLALYLAKKRFAPDIRFQRTMVRSSTAKELSSYCFGLTIISFSMLLVTGFDLVLVGRFQFAMVTPYSVSASMVVLISGLVSAIVNVILPHSAALHAGQKAGALGSLVIASTRISMLLLILSGVPILIYAGPILRLWIGERFVESGTPILLILVIANIIRLIGLPYTVVLVATDQQRFIKIPPLAEGITNFAASIALGLRFGALGVAVGTLIGALVSVASHLSYSMPRTRAAIELSRRKFLLSGVALPMLATSPLIVVAVVNGLGIAVSPWLVGVASAVSLGAAVYLTLRARDNAKLESFNTDEQRAQVVSP